MRTRISLAAIVAAFLLTTTTADAKPRWDCEVKGSHEMAREAWDYPHKRSGKIQHVRYIARCSGERIVRRHIADARKAYRNDRDRAQAENAYGGIDPPGEDYLYRLRMCESGGDYSTNTGNGFYGAYQFDLPTWGSVGGSGLPSDASPAEQDYRAAALYRSRGSSPWPVCG